MQDLRESVCVCVFSMSSYVSLHVCLCMCVSEVSVQMRGNQAKFVYLGKA